MLLGKLVKTVRHHHIAVHVEDHEGNGPCHLEYHVREVAFVIDEGASLVPGARPKSVLPCSCKTPAPDVRVYLDSEVSMAA